MKGVLLFAFNNEQVNYTRMARICAARVQKYWDLPVCIISDDPRPVKLPQGVTFWRQVERPDRVNTRGYQEYGQALTFWNTNRHDAYELTPFSETILLDTDFLVQTRNVVDAWSGKGVKVSKSAYSVDGTPLTNDMKYLSVKTQLPMYWATIVCFDKSPISEEFFRQWKTAVDMYSVYSTVFGFESGPMRNDFAVTVALERMKGNTQNVFFDLPYTIPTLLPGSTLLSLDPLIAFVPSKHPEEMDMLPVCSDLHVMNKKSIIECSM